MTAIAWPKPLRPNSVMFHPNIPSASGGASLTGSEQVVQSSSGRWRAKVSLSVFSEGNNHAKLFCARAMLAHLKGRANTVYLPVYDDGNAPSPMIGGASGDSLTTFGDGATFSDGTKFAQQSSPAVTTIDAPAGSLSLVMAMINPSQTPQAGQYFGYGHAEAYLINSSVANGDGSYTVQFWPPLRSDHNAGNEINMTNPTVEMRLMSDDSGELQLQTVYVGDQALEFVEAV